VSCAFEECSCYETPDASVWKVLAKEVLIGLSMGLAILICIAVAAALLGGCAGRLPTDRQMFERAASSTVRVECTGGLGSGAVVGSGNGRTVILTAYHVVLGEPKITVVGPRMACPGRVLNFSPSEDLALVEVLCDLGQPVLPIASRPPLRYSTVWLVGAFNGWTGTPSRGSLASTSFDVTGLVSKAYLVTMPIWHGDSGAALLNEAGEIVGVASRIPAALEPVFGSPVGQNPADPDAEHYATPLVSQVEIPTVSSFVGLPAIRSFLGLR